MGDECNICLENYNKSIKIGEVKYRSGPKITCTKCDYSSCTHCTKKYILDSINDTRCMNCQHPWNREFLVNNFTKIFINKEYKKHREDILYDREKSFIPATMEILNKENEIKELKREKEIFRKKMEDNIRDYNAKIEELKRENEIKELKMEDNIHDYNAKIEELIKEKEKFFLKMEANQNYFDVKIKSLENSSGNTKKTNTFIHKCHVDECKGFLSSKWKCGICESYTCKNCHEVVGKKIYNDNETTELPSHTCNEDNVKTAQLLVKDCKNCPKCSVQIYKIDGCDQMWCVECKTAFSWKTLEIIIGQRFHNPHYYEWLRQNNNGNAIPREIGDNPCYVPITSITNHINNILFNNCTNLGELPKNTEFLIAVMDFYRLRTIEVVYKYNDYNIIYIISFIEELERLRNHIADYNNTIDSICLMNDENHLFNYNLKLRKSYLKSSTTEETFKKEIQKNEKKKLKLINLKQIYLTFINVINDIFQKLISKPEMKNIFSCLEEILNIINHINIQLVKHSNIYNCKVDKLDIFKFYQKYHRFNYGTRETNIRSLDINFTKKHKVPPIYTLEAFKI